MMISSWKTEINEENTQSRGVVESMDSVEKSWD